MKALALNRLIKNKKVIFFINGLNFLLLACFFELFWSPWMAFHSDEEVIITEADLTYEFNRKKKKQEVISLYARSENGKMFVLMCGGSAPEEMKFSVPFRLGVDKDYIFRIPVKAAIGQGEQSYLLKDFIPVLFLSIFGIIHNVILVLYRKNLTGDVLILGFLNIAIFFYLIYFSYR